MHGPKFPVIGTVFKSFCFVMLIFRRKSQILRVIKLIKLGSLINKFNIKLQKIRKHYLEYEITITDLKS